MHLGANTGGLVNRLKNERDRFVAFAFASADILMELDEDGSILYVDGAVKDLLDMYPAELSGKLLVQAVHSDDIDIAEHLLSTDSRSRVDNIAIRLNTRDGGSYPFIMSGYKISELHGHFYLTFSCFRNDINISDIARRDLKTGLLRKSEFCLTVNKQIAMSKLQREVPQLTIISLKNFEAIEAEHVNELTKNIADLIRVASINSDSAGWVSEGVISFVHDKNLDIEAVKKEIHEIAKCVAVKGKALDVTNVTVSLDTIKDVSEEDTVQSILYTLDKFSKAKNENARFVSLVECYEEMVGETVSRLSEFKRIVETEAFDLAFQPIVEVRTGKITHFEVLTRLRDAKTFANPFDFIEFGENVGLISEYDMKMCRRTVELLNELDALDISPVLSVNLSGYSLSSQAFMDSLYQLLLENENLCKNIMFEITESAKLSNKKYTNEYFQKLRVLGVKSCIDDFGSGEATFEYLRHLNVDIVKIDGSYVSDDAVNSDNGRHLLRAIGRLCRDLKVDVVAEKVENLASANMLAECGIKYAQGYFYAKPSIDREILKLTDVESKKATVTNIEDYR